MVISIIMANITICYTSIPAYLVERCRTFILEDLRSSIQGARVLRGGLKADLDNVWSDLLGIYIYSGRDIIYQTVALDVN